MGLMGFEFVEFTSPQPVCWLPCLKKLGFTLVAKHRSRTWCCTARTASTSFEPQAHSQAAYFGAEHGPRPAAWPSA